MKLKKRKLFVFIFLLVFILILLINQKVYANNNEEKVLKQVEYTDAFKNWLQLPEDERKKTMMPRMYEVETPSFVTKSPFLKASMLGTGIERTYNLKTVIPNNLIIKNQMSTYSCWAFATLSSLETNIALSNYKNKVNTSNVYDYSERHMEYFTSRKFKNNAENTSGYNRAVGDGGNWQIAESYLTNGSGAINEDQMRFQDNENPVELSDVQGKTVTSQVYDTVYFPDYRNKSSEEKEQIMNQIKQHIKDHGSVYASLHGNSSSISAFSCYDNNTAAKYCDNTLLHQADHAVSIIGWDDDFGIENFSGSSKKPTSNGAWIIRNSWGSSIGKQGLMYVSYEDCNISTTLYGIVKANDTVDYDNLYQYDEFTPFGVLSSTVDGLMLCNVFDKKTDKDEFLTQISLHSPDTYTCKVYVNPKSDSKAKGDLQPVTLKTGETQTVNEGYHTLEFATPVKITGNQFAVVVVIQGKKVKINLESKMKNIDIFNYVDVKKNKCFVTLSDDLAKCTWHDLGSLSTDTSIGSNLSDGDSSIKAFTVSEVLDGSLKSIEIAHEPKKLTYIEGDDFVKDGLQVKANYNSRVRPSVILDDASYEISDGTDLQFGQEEVTITYGGKEVKQHITVEKNVITDLKIKTPPKKLTYKEGENFDDTEMVVEATYKNGDKKTVKDYKIENGKNLNREQRQITITYEGMSVTQDITVEKNNITEIKITSQPEKVVYKEGEDFETKGMVVEAVFESGSSEAVTGYSIEGGENLELGQGYVTILYGGRTVRQDITVEVNELVEIKITKQPDKITYVEGQDFVKDGMIVKAIYENNATVEINDYTIENGEDLKSDQTEVIIKYKEKSVSQSITVDERAVTQISIVKKPNKVKYIKDEGELELEGGIIQATYNDGTTENVEMTSEGVSVEGFSNERVGKVTITVKYLDKSTQFDVEIIESEIKPDPDPAPSPDPTPAPTPDPTPDPGDDKKAVNTDLSDIKTDVKNVQAHFYTDTSKENYIVVNVEINNISRNMNNDKVEYYYYISANANEKNINNWTKITENQSDKDKLQFAIDSRKLPNYGEVVSEDVIYLYIKEVAIKGGNQSIAISNPMKLEVENQNIETYLNDTKKESSETVNTNKSNNNGTTNKDNTLANGKIPQTGIKLTVGFLIVTIAVVGGIVYIRYKNISKYVK